MICACTGSRPANFPWDYYGIAHARYKSLLRAELRTLAENGVEEFISGMAMGADIDIAEEVLALKNEYPYLRLVCMIPFKGQDKCYPESWKLRYKDVLSRADEAKVLNEEYNPHCFHARNRLMVDKADMLFAVWNGKQTGGTAYTIKYAMKTNKDVRLFNLEDCTWSE